MSNLANHDYYQEAKSCASGTAFGFLAMSIQADLI
jgi:hypothetical protein